MNTDDNSDNPTSDADTDRPTARMLAWARNSAAYRLSRRMMTEKQLADAIRRKAKEKLEDIDDARIQALVESALTFGRGIGALDDAAYAETAARSALRSGRSKRATARKLAEKGVDRETAALATEESEDLHAAVIYARKRGFGPFRRVALDEARKAKELSAFARQGFGFDIGRKVLNLSEEEAGDILDLASLG